MQSIQEIQKGTKSDTACSSTKNQKSNNFKLPFVTPLKYTTPTVKPKPPAKFAFSNEEKNCNNFKLSESRSPRSTLGKNIVNVRNPKTYKTPFFQNGRQNNNFETASFRIQTNFAETMKQKEKPLIKVKNEGNIIVNQKALQLEEKNYRNGNEWRPTTSFDLSLFQMFLKRNQDQFTPQNENKNLFNLTFTFGKEKKKIYAHKNVIIAHSSVIERDLSPFSENYEIAIEHYPYKIFFDFVKLLYNPYALTLTEKTYKVMVKLAQDYDVDILKKYCIFFLSVKLRYRKSNVVQIYDDLKMYKWAQDVVYDKMMRFYPDCVYTRKLFNCCKETVLKLVQEERPFTDEKDFFKQICKWIQYNFSSKKLKLELPQDLKDILEFMKFNTMSKRLLRLFANSKPFLFPPPRLDQLLENSRIYNIVVTDKHGKQIRGELHDQNEIAEQIQKLRDVKGTKLPKSCYWKITRPYRNLKSFDPSCTDGNYFLQGLYYEDTRLVVIHLSENRCHPDALLAVLSFAGNDFDFSDCKIFIY